MANWTNGITKQWYHERECGSWTNVTPTDNSKDIAFERAQTGPTTYNNVKKDMPNGTTELKTGAPSIYDILNNKPKKLANKISRAKTISLDNSSTNN